MNSFDHNTYPLHPDPEKVERLVRTAEHYVYNPPKIKRTVNPIPDNQVWVTTVRNPFDIENPDNRILQKLPLKVFSKGVWEYVKEIYPTLPQHWDIEVSINGMVIPKEELETIFIPGGSSLVFCLVPHGSGSGSKIWKWIAMIVIIVLSVLTYQYYGVVVGWTALGLSVSEMSLIAASLVYAVGTALVNVMFASAGPDASVGGTQEMEQDSPTYAWDVRGNNYIEGKPIPVLYGTRRIQPYIIARHIVTAGNPGLQYLNLLMAVADHEVDTMTDVEINENPIENFDDVEILKRYGTTTQDVVEYFNDTYTLKTVGMNLDREDPIDWTVTQTNGNVVEGIIVGISFPRGLFRMNDAGNPRDYTVSLKFQYKESTSETWLDWTGSEFTDGVVDITGDQTEVRRCIFRIDSLSPATYDIRIKFDSLEPYELKTRYSNHCTFDYIEEIIYDDFRYPGISLLAMNALATNQISGGMPTISVLVSRNTVPVYDSNNKQMVSDGNCRLDQPAMNTVDPTVLNSTISWLTGDDVVHGGCLKVLGNTTATEAGLYFADGSNCGLTATKDYDVSVDVYIPSGQGITGVYLKWKNNSGSDFTLDSDTVPTEDEWITLSGSFTDDDAQRVLWIEFTATDTDTLYIHIDNFSCREDGTVEGWDNKDATNPTWVCYDMLINDNYGAGVDYTKILFNDFQIWADWCDDEGFACNLYIDSAMSLPKALSMAETLGRGRVVQKGSKFSVIVDKIDEPVQMFTMGNIKEKTFKESFLNLQDRANCIEITYWDENKSYSRQTLEVRTADFNAETDISVNKNSQMLYGCTNRQLALRHAQFLLNCNNYIQRTIAFEVDIDALACQIGDLIYFSHDVPQWGTSGRIQQDGIAEDDTELVTNGDCESALPTIGAVSVTGTYSTPSQSTTQKHAGTYSMQVLGNTSGTVMYIHYANPSLTEGKMYKHSVWVYIPSGQGITKVEFRSRDADNNISLEAETNTENTWVQLWGYFIYEAGSSQRTFEVKVSASEVNGKSIYLDDFSLIIPAHIALDSPVLLEESVERRMIIRHQDTDVLEEVTLATVQKDYTFGTVDEDCIVPINGDWTAVPEAPALYTYGPVNNVTKEFRIISITRAKDFTRKVAAIEYFDAIYDDSISISSGPPENNYSVVYNLAASERWMVQDGVGYGTIHLTWTGSAIYYNIWRREAGTTEWTYVNRVAASDYIISTGLDLGHTYQFTVSPTNDPGLTPYVEVEFDGVPDITDAPEDLAVSYSAEDVAIRITWTLVQDAQVIGYDINIGDTSVAQAHAGNIFLYPILLPVGFHTIKVRSRDIWNQVSAWATKNFTVTQAFAPTNITPLVIDNNVMLSWDASIPGTYEIREYEIRGCLTSASVDWDSDPVIGIKSGTFTHHMVNTGGNYTYRIKAIDIGGNYGLEASVTTEVDSPPDFVLINNWNLDFDQGTAGDEKVTNGNILINTALHPTGCCTDPNNDKAKTSDRWQMVGSGYYGWTTGGQTGYALEIKEMYEYANPTVRNHPTYMPITLTSGKQYVFSFYVKQGTEATYQAYIYYNDAKQHGATTNTEATGSWVKHTYVFTATYTGTAYIYLQQICAESAGTYILFDDVILYEITEPTMNSIALTKSNCVLSVSYDQAYSDFVSLKMLGNATSTSMEIYFPDGSDCGLSAGHVYGVSVRVYIPSGQGITNVQLYYRDSDANDTELDSTTTTDSWVELSGNLPDDDADRIFYIKVSATDTDTLYIYLDNFTCIEDIMTNCYVRDDGSMVAPINTTETWSEHFTNNSKTTLQGFVDAGYTYMPEPVPSSAAYQETLNEGVEISLANVQTTLTKEDYNGGAAITKYIAEKQYGDDAWNEQQSVSEYFSEFQFLRTRLSIASSDNKKFCFFINQTVTLNQRKKVESGMGTVTYPATYATITFTGTYYDIISINVTPLGDGSQEIIPIVDFTDAPNPTSFDVYLVDGSGSALPTSGSIDFSWMIEAY